VTYDRAPILTSPQARECLRTAWQTVQERFPFIILAICLLPDHLHAIWSLPEGDINYSVRWKEIKRLFSMAYLDQVDLESEQSFSRLRRGDAPVWQRRFWEHTLRDERDYYNHLDYLHYNPVKHGLVQNVADWPWSSFHRFVKNGWYSPDWGSDVGEKLGDFNCGE
jgi:putative transposase